MNRGLLAAGVLAVAAVARFAALNAGSTKDERTRELPGDDALVDGHAVGTEAITIEAPPDAVWPWLVDMEAARAEVAVSEPDHLLVLRRKLPRAEATRAYVLEPDGDRTRLLVRTRVRTRPRLFGPLLLVPTVRRRLCALARTASSHYNASEGPVEVAGA